MGEGERGGRRGEEGGDPVLSQSSLPFFLPSIQVRERREMGKWEKGVGGWGSGWREEGERTQSSLKALFHSSSPSQLVSWRGN